MEAGALVFATDQWLAPETGAWLAAGVLFVGLFVIVRATRSLRDQGDVGGAPDLSGVVADDGGGPAAEVVVDQEYVARDGWAVWREVGRRATVRAVTLLLDDGQRVVIESPRSARLWWPLEDTESTGETTRRRAARLRPGDRVSVYGVASVDGQGGGPFREELGRAQVTSGVVTLLHPSLGPSLAAGLRRLRWLRAITAAATALLLLSLAWHFWGSRPVQGSLRDIELDGSNHAGLVLDTPLGPHRFVVSRDAVGDLRAEGQAVALRQGPWPVTLVLGADRGLHAAWAFLSALFMVLVGLASVLVGARARGRHWWERPNFEEPAPLPRAA